MSRDAHLAAIEQTRVSLAILRARIVFSRDTHYTQAAASCIASIGLPSDLEAPGGAVFQALEQIHQHLDQARFWTEEAIDDLNTYRKGV